MDKAWLGHSLYIDLVGSFKADFILERFKIKLFCDVYEEILDSLPPFISFLIRLI